MTEQDIQRRIDAAVQAERDRILACIDDELNAVGECLERTDEVKAGLRMARRIVRDGKRKGLVQIRGWR
jgi:hypothetical protein